MRQASFRVASVAVAAAVAATFVVAAAGGAASTVAPAGAVRFPVGFTGQIYVGDVKAWPTTPPASSTTTVLPSTSVAPSSSTVPSTSSTPPSTTVPATTAPSTTTTAPATTTTSPATTTTVPATTTTMAAMSNMPFVDPTKIPGPSARSWTGPFIVPQDHPYQTSDGTGAFRVTTRYTNFGYADPIAFPGGVSPHLHLFFGNKCVTSTMTDPTTCGSTTSDGGTLNKTAYWVPAVIDTNTHAPIMPADMQVYYKTGYNGVAPSTVQPFPVGLKIVAGDSKRTTAEPGPQYDHITQWECDNGNGGDFDHLPTGCQPGTWLVLEVAFPQCWDGVHLDSADHKSHMAFANNGCPADHPIALPEITERALYTVPASGTSSWRLSSDNYVGGPGGYSAHGDWWNGWDVATMQQVVTGCENVPRDCSMDLLGNGTQLGFGPN